MKNAYFNNHNIDIANSSAKTNYRPTTSTYTLFWQDEIGSIAYESSDLAKFLDFENTKDVILHTETFCDFLVGTWRTSDDKYYFTMSRNHSTTYNLPWFDYGDYYEIEDGIYSLYSEKDPNNSRSLFKFTIVGKDVILVYCYKDGNEYRLIRE